MYSPSPESVRSQRAAGGLAAIQRFAAGAIMRSLDDQWQARRDWADGRSTEEVVGEFIKPNSRLTAFERIEIYNRQYWFRLFDSIHEDFPGLRNVIGENRFRRLALAYMAACPSRSFTLRNLGDRLPQFIRENVALTRPHFAIARDMADFEWAQIVAFDGPSKPPINPVHLAQRDPATLLLDLQPHLTLLDLAYPVDEFFTAVKRRDASLRGQASNAVDQHRTRQGRRVTLPKRRRVFLAVHRHGNEVYLKRLTRPAFATLAALRDGQALLDACAVGMAAGRTTADDFKRWFQLWAELGWLTRRSTSTHGTNTTLETP